MTTVPYGWKTAEPTHVGELLLDGVRAALPPPPLTVLDYGCGNGFIASQLTSDGYTVTGYDPDSEGVAIAAAAHPEIPFTSTIPAGRFNAVVSTEVIEHVFDTHEWCDIVRSTLNQHGLLLCTTPYHGYLKNLALSVTDRWDTHWNPAYTGGHIKFFSPTSITALLEQHGFRVEQVSGLGRVRYLWKSMLVVARAV